MKLLKNILFFFVILLFLALITISFIKIENILIEEILAVIFCISATGMKASSLVSSYRSKQTRKASDIVLYIVNIVDLAGINSLVVIAIFFKVDMNVFIFVTAIFGLVFFIPIPKKAS